ncbi:MAG: right-handed parallel beta-helix repeat-containing protein [Ruminococcaceae bacterium]|nr:right-handed parallel beta-helix repeat-containing protein [Oscillospiraceae bacterium]
MWKVALWHVDDIIQDPENENQVIVLMDRRQWHQLKKQPTASMANETRGFVVENAYELLDQPGEFYFNKKTKTLSYMPREGEDMTTAEVLCPQTDRLLYICGKNNSELVHNIRFENIKLAHASNSLMEDTSYYTGQGEYHCQSHFEHRIGWANNVVSWAEYVDFEACQFYGLEGMGLHFRDGVYRCEVVGNVFTDIGATAFVAGQIEQVAVSEAPKVDGPVDVAWRAGWYSSYHYAPGTGYTFEALNTQRSCEWSMEPGRGWCSEPYVYEEGTFPWIRLELEDKFTLESFRFSFPDYATETERSNFEVLISNDREFNEYKTLATYTGPADFIEEIPIGDGEKYQYIMLRKTVSEPFALDGVWAMSYDKDYYVGTQGAPTDCLIANNYFARPGQVMWNTYPIWLIYTARFKVLHNEIYDSPYSAMSIGWGWENDNETARENDISYNRIDKVMRQINDGGGIYIFGEQWGSKVTHNYITNVFNLHAAIYHDNGSRGITSADNVALNTGYAWLQNGGNAYDNVMTGMYSDIGAYYYLAVAGENEYDDAIITSITDPSEEAARIMAEAGIEDEWLWIKERIPETDTQRTILLGPDASESYKIKSTQGLGATSRLAHDTKIASFLIDNADFGYLPWEIDPELKEEIQYWLDACDTNGNRTDDVNGGHIEEMHGLEFAILDAMDSVYHPTYDEMLAMCDELLAAAEGVNALGSYPAEAIANSKKDIAAVKATNPETRGDKGVAAIKLEKIYKKLAGQKRNAGILSFTVEGGTSVIDGENQTITVSLLDGVDRTALTPSIDISPGTKLATELSDLDFTEEFVILPLYHEDLQRYTFWTVRFVSGNLEDQVVEGAASFANAADWIGGNVNVEFLNAGGAVGIASWQQPSMNKTAVNGNYKFSLWAPQADTTNGIGIIFSAQTPELEATTKRVENTYYMLELKGQDLTLYRVRGGVKTLCNSAQNIRFNYGRFNPFEITVKPEGEVDKVMVRLEGDLIMDALVAEPVGPTGYFGILTPYVTVKVK